MLLIGGPRWEALCDFFVKKIFKNSIDILIANLNRFCRHKALQSEPEQDLCAFSALKRTPNGSQNDKKSSSGESVVFATAPIRNPWF